MDSAFVMPAKRVIARTLPRYGRGLGAGAAEGKWGLCSDRAPAPMSLRAPSSPAPPVRAAPRPAAPNVEPRRERAPDELPLKRSEPHVTPHPAASPPSRGSPVPSSAMPDFSHAAPFSEDERSFVTRHLRVGKYRIGKTLDLGELLEPIDDQ